jgi:protein phosphatase
MVSPEEIADVVRSNRTEKACHSLVALANDRGGDDNISLIVFKINDVSYKKKGIFGRIFGIDT